MLFCGASVGLELKNCLRMTRREEKKKKEQGRLYKKNVRVHQLSKDVLMSSQKDLQLDKDKFEYENI